MGSKDWPEIARQLAKSLAAELPELELNFAPSSLGRLEAEVLRRFTDPAQLAAPEARPFVDGVAAYFGEVMCGLGGWGWSTAWEWGHSSPWEGDDRPEVNAWKDLHYAISRPLPGFVPWDVIADAVRDRSGSEFLDRYEDWDSAAMEMVDELASAEDDEDEDEDA
ncbi:hypothetical protein [Nocardia carnea]|uniref:hypothetical protein n=1 Tax=Nocardia carnea TaxID=37328 RepID=UPI0024580B08|nr:hypothetical protein [Nocardia carnea]